MEYASSVGASRRRVGVPGLEWDGELKANNRRRVGVVGATSVALDRVGEAGGWIVAGVTSVCNIEVKSAFACSFNASDSVGIILLLDGVDGVTASMR